MGDGTYGRTFLPQGITVLQNIVESHRRSLFQEDGELRRTGERKGELDGVDAEEVDMADVDQLLELVLGLSEFLLAYVERDMT